MRVIDTELKRFTGLLREVFGFIHAMMPEEDNAHVYIKTGDAEKKTKTGTAFVVAFPFGNSPFFKRVIGPGLKRIISQDPTHACSFFVPAHKRGVHFQIALDALSPSGFLSKWASAEGTNKWTTINDWQRHSPTFKIGLEYGCTDLFHEAMRVRVENGILMTNMGVDHEPIEEAV